MSDDLELRAEIRPVKETVEDELLARPGVIGVDIGEKISRGKPTGDLSIVVYVDKKKPKTQLDAAELVPKTVDGVKTDVQEIVVELQRMTKLEATALIDATVYPTLHGGISMGPSRSVYLAPPDVPSAGNYVFVGTLGAMVRDRATGATMGMTNFHVACVNDGWSVGDRMVQPGRPDGGNPATQEFGALVRAVLSENTDGAVVSVDAGRAWDYTVEGIGDVAGTTAATVGAAVQKRGRTTEHTFGTVGSTDVTLSIDYGDGLGVRTLRHQIRVDTNTALSARFSDHGDSGSVVMDMNRNVIGLLFAGSSDGAMTFANPIAVALDELGVDMLVRPAITPTRPILRCLDTRLTVCRITRPDPCPVLTRTVSCTSRTLCPTRPVMCDDFLTRAVSCLTRTTCPTRPTLCEFEVSRPVCDLVTRGGCFEDIVNPGEIINPRIPGRFGSQYDSGDLEQDPAYLAGYLAALEEIAGLDEEGEN